ncbi:MAG: serine hydrolase domain-containing protein [Pseudomonadota bacterium]
MILKDNMLMVDTRLSSKLFLLIVSFVFALVTPAHLQEPSDDQAEPIDIEVVDDSPAAGIDRFALETFVDGILATELDDHAIAGATVSIVSPTETLLLKGYGFADTDMDEPVDPEKHLFRIASISKTFTATAIMMLVEQGLIDLDADIRTYLGDLGFDDSLGAITTADLLTHTAGFEDRIFGFYGDTPELEPLPREEQFAGLAPAQVRAPGDLVSYSNYSYSLLGEIIARVSGNTYAGYIRDEIFDPLGMERSAVQLKSFGVEPTEKMTRLLNDESESHIWKNGDFETQTFAGTLDLHEAAANVSTTAADMINYMQAHLNLGEAATSRIFSAETAARMHSVLFTHMPGVNGNAHGFWVMNMGGYDTLEHGGSINDFKSIFVLFPELGLGVFISGNTDSSGVLRRVPERIVEEFFPQPDPLSYPDSAFEAFDAGQMTGRYVSTRRNDTRFGKIASAAGFTTVSETDDGDLLIGGGARSIRYRKDEAGVYRSARDGSPIRFETGLAGKPTRLFFGSNPYGALEKLTFANNPMTMILPIALAVLASIGVIAGYVLPFLGFQPASVGAIAKPERYMVAGMSILLLGLTAHTGSTILGLLNDINIIYEAFPTPAFRLVFAGAWLVALLSIPLVILTGMALVGQDRTVFQKVRLTAFTLIVLLFVFMLFHWNFVTA